MNGNPPATKFAAAPAPARSFGYWSGFTVFLFIVLLALFTWVVQRRVAQYESLQQAGGHHLTATKVCLTDRIGTNALLPAVPALAGFALLLCALLSPGTPGTASMARLLIATPSNSLLTRLRRLLPHLFFLPPPPFLSTL
jgi:glycerol-3-phosphate acyltransferase PlsY